MAALAMAVWIIYIADRLLDVRRMGRQDVVTERHRFHRDHALQLGIFASFCFGGLVFVAMQLNSTLVRNGLVLSIVVMAYFLIIHFFKPMPGFYSKELTVGILFAAGVVLAPLSAFPHVLPFVGPMILFALLCFLNCAAIETWEWRNLSATTPAQVPEPHALTLWLVRHMRMFTSVIAAVGLLLAYLSANAVYAAVVISALGYLWLDIEREHLASDVLRVLADVPLLSPFFLLIRFH